MPSVANARSYANYQNEFNAVAGYFRGLQTAPDACIRTPQRPPSSLKDGPTTALP